MNYNIRYVIENSVKDNVKFKKLGGITRVNPCPFCLHKDCFTIYHNTNSYSCFSCGMGGDTINFLMNYFNMNFTEVCKKWKLKTK